MRLSLSAPTKRRAPGLAPAGTSLRGAGEYVNDRLLTTRQVAEWLGFSPETVLRRYRAGELRGIRLASNVLRFRESDLREWLDAFDDMGRGREEKCHPPLLEESQMKDDDHAC